MDSQQSLEAVVVGVPSWQVGMRNEICNMHGAHLPVRPNVHLLVQRGRLGAGQAEDTALPLV